MRTNSDDLRDAIQAAVNAGEAPYRSNLHGFRCFHKEPVDFDEGIEAYRYAAATMPQLIQALQQLISFARARGRAVR